MNNLNLNELYIFENRVYRLVKKPFHNNNPNGIKLRPLLILVKQDELNKLLIDEVTKLEGKK